MKEVQIVKNSLSREEDSFSDEASAAVLTNAPSSSPPQIKITAGFPRGVEDTSVKDQITIRGEGGLAMTMHPAPVPVKPAPTL